MTHNILVVDDEPKLCDLLASALGQNSVQVFIAGNGLHALKVLEQEDIDLVISDWRMPGMDGPALLAEIKVRYPHVPVIVMTAYSTVKNAVQSMRNGAYDYIAKPFDIDELDITVTKALQFRDIMRDNARLRAELDEHAQFDSLVGDSPAFRKVLQAVDSVRDSSATILLTGSNRNGQGQVAPRQPGHDIGRRPAWAATHQNHPDGNLGRQVENLAEQPRHTGHDHEMSNHAQRNAPRVAGDFSEVIEFKGQAHAEHHHTQKRHDGAFEADKPAGLQKRQHGKNQHPVSKGITDKAA